MRDLLPGGCREGAEWRCGSTAGEPGHSLGVHLIGERAGVWSDFATGERGDALDLVRIVLGADTVRALDWSRRWLGIEAGIAELPPITAAHPAPSPDDLARWRRPWGEARPIDGTIAARYLAARRLRFSDPKGRVLRYAPHRWRRQPETDRLENHSALLALLRDLRSGEPCGVINIFLLPNGADRLRDPKGKTTAGRAASAAVMLSPYGEPTGGLTVCEGVETGIALLQADLA
ncbi:MAG: DUF7146 domain-containing protein, partial [Stellaceae bacterium]